MGENSLSRICRDCNDVVSNGYKEPREKWDIRARHDQREDKIIRRVLLMAPHIQALSS